MEYEFTKVLVRPVVQQRDGGKIVGENVGTEIPLFSAAQVAEFMAEMERQTAAVNAEQGNRQQKRAGGKKSGGKKSGGKKS